MLNKLLLLSLLACLSCAPSGHYFKTTKSKYSPKSKNCDFEITATLPRNQSNLKEIGVVDIEPGSISLVPFVGYLTLPKTLGDLRETISDQTCAAGADLAVADSRVHEKGYLRAVLYVREN